MGEVFFEGLILQASLIFALGPQNLFVLESGLRRQHHILVSIVCFLCDLSLIMLGVIGAATFFNHFPQIKIIVGVLGVGFLVLYGLGKIRQNADENYVFDTGPQRSTRKAAILNSITFSVVNPHAYLDGIVLIGGYSSKYPEIGDRLNLGLGAATCSLLWFLVLSLGAGAMMPLFQNQKRMRFIMGSAGVILLFLSVRLSVDVYAWIEEIYPQSVAIIPVK